MNHEYSTKNHLDFFSLTGMGRGDITLNIVDIGAELLESSDHIYASLMEAAQVNLVAFDPFMNEQGNRNGDDNIVEDLKGRTASLKILPYFAGTGKQATFHVNKFRPTSSLYPTNHALLNDFFALSKMCRSKKTMVVDTARLDEIIDLPYCDLLKLDIQGSELDALKGAEKLLNKTLVIHTEAEFSPVYRNQPLFADIDTYLRENEFEFIDFISMGYNRYKAFPNEYSKSRLLWTDCIYLKSTAAMLDISNMALIHAALIMHENYKKYDLAAHLLKLHDKRYRTRYYAKYVAAIKRSLS